MQAVNIDLTPETVGAWMRKKSPLLCNLISVDEFRRIIVVASDLQSKWTDKGMGFPDSPEVALEYLITQENIPPVAAAVVVMGLQYVYNCILAEEEAGRVTQVNESSNLRH